MKLVKMFKENDVYQFEDFITSHKKSLQEMKRKKGKTTAGFVHRKLTQVYNVMLYYKFLRSDDSSKKLAKDPKNWVKDDFDDWIDDERHPTVASAEAASTNTTSSGTTTTTNATATPATVYPDPKKAENSWMSW